MQQIGCSCISIRCSIIIYYVNEDLGVVVCILNCCKHRFSSRHQFIQSTFQRQHSQFLIITKQYQYFSVNSQAYQEINLDDFIQLKNQSDNYAKYNKSLDSILTLDQHDLLNKLDQNQSNIFIFDDDKQLSSNSVQSPLDKLSAQQDQAQQLSPQQDQTQQLSLQQDQTQQPISNDKNAKHDEQDKQNDFIKQSSQYRFKGIHSFLNDVEFSSLAEIPIDSQIKRQIEDLLVLPRQNFHELNFQQKHNRLLFFGFSKELMENTAKALAIQNKWLFSEIDSDEMILKFMNNDDIGFKRVFQYAKKESMDQKATYLIVIKNIEQLLESQSEGNGLYSGVVEQAREWLFEQLQQYNSYQNQFEDNKKDIFSEVYDIVVVFISGQPQKINEMYLQRLVNKAIYFDFTNLRGIKIFFAQELQKLTSKVNMQKSKKQMDEEQQEMANLGIQADQTQVQNTDNSQPQTISQRFKKVRNRQINQQMNQQTNQQDNSNGQQLEDVGQMRRRRKNIRDQNQNSILKKKTLNNLRRNQYTMDYGARLNDHDEQLPFGMENRNQRNQVQRDQDIVDRVFQQNLNNQIMQSFIEIKEEQTPDFSQMQNQQEQEDSLYQFDNHVKEQKRRQKRRDLLRCARYVHKQSQTQIIRKNQLFIVIEKRQDMQQWLNNGQLLGDDNIIMIKGPQICIIFDWDFDSYLIDHALAIKSSQDPYRQWPDQEVTNMNSELRSRLDKQIGKQYFEKAGLVYEDVRNIIKLTIHIEIKENSNILDDYDMYDPYYQITEKTLKEGFLNYKNIVDVRQSNMILGWARLHNYLVTKLQYMAGQMYQVDPPPILPDQNYYSNPIDIQQSPIHQGLQQPIQGTHQGFQQGLQQSIQNPQMIQQNQQIMQQNQQMIHQNPQMIQQNQQMMGYENDEEMNNDLYDDDYKSNPVIVKHHQTTIIHHNDELDNRISEMHDIENRINQKLQLLDMKMVEFQQSLARQQVFRQKYQHLLMNDDSLQAINNDQDVINDQLVANQQPHRQYDEEQEIQQQQDSRDIDKFYNKAYKYGLMEQQMVMDPQDSKINQINYIVEQNQTNELLDKKKKLIGMLNQLKQSSKMSKPELLSTLSSVKQEINMANQQPDINNKLSTLERIMDRVSLML